LSFQVKEKDEGLERPFFFWEEPDGTHPRKAPIVLGELFSWRLGLTAGFPAAYIFVRFAGARLDRSPSLLGSHPTSPFWGAGLRGLSMRLVVAFFIALLAIPIIQIAADRWSERAQSGVLAGPGNGLTIANGKHHRSRDLEFTVPRFDWRPKTG
jgi:hypothetical protein